jgi:CubicO group peptidase (beta-lactamase class C family)
VVERRSGQPLGGYLKTRIFEPLHLKMSVGYDSPVPGKATSYKYNNLNQPRVADWRWDAFGSGGLQTTPTRLVVWADTTAAAWWAEPTSNETSSPARCRPP